MLKSKYYEEIKAGSRLDPEQKKAIDFFNRYNEDQETAIKQHESQSSIRRQMTFLLTSSKVLNITSGKRNSGLM